MYTPLLLTVETVLLVVAGLEAVSVALFAATATGVMPSYFTSCGKLLLPGTALSTTGRIADTYIGVDAAVRVLNIVTSIKALSAAMCGV